MAAISSHFTNDIIKLTDKHLETYGFVLNTKITNDLVLKHQTICIHSADWKLIKLDQFHTKILHV